MTKKAMMARVTEMSDYEIDDIDFEKDKVDKDKHNDEA